MGGGYGVWRAASAPECDVPGSQGPACQTSGRNYYGSAHANTDWAGKGDTSGTERGGFGSTAGHKSSGG